MKVKVWEENIQIPTYGIGNPEKHPMFLEKRVYQGASGVVYPYPVIEKVDDKPTMQTWQAVWIENEYIKVMILPALGGRIQRAYDKIKKRDFVYYNHVIKPALVGLTGPWISGGIEFNWPQHHRPSTYLPVDYKIEECEDGSAIIWVSERERMYHQKGMIGFTLRPGRAVLELNVKLYNPTALPQNFLWWGNPAVAVNDAYQSVFPNDVNAVFDHGKRDVSRYPIATGIYYKKDYSAGVDISRYKNITVPTSYMAIKSNYDFVGGYENDTQAGLLHVCNHHVSPGKKQWTWGNGDFGQAWDRNLTDDDGPYIELMTGVYADNQPDFTYLKPYEEKKFTQYFMPYRELGVVKNASSDLLLNIEKEENGYELKIFATRAFSDLNVNVIKDAKRIFETTFDVSPEELFKTPIHIKDLKGVSVVITNNEDMLMLTWSQPEDKIKPIPDAAKALESPSDIATTEDLYFAGQHLEQYHHATYSPIAYYEEALKRDPTDMRNNHALGQLYLRKGQFAKAEKHIRTAVEKITKLHPNPSNGEPIYDLGLVLKLQGRVDEAYDCFYKATWNAPLQDISFFALAQISLGRNELKNALHEINESLLCTSRNHNARHLKTIILRQMNRQDEALALIDESLEMDPFNFGCLFERYLITETSNDLREFNENVSCESRNYEELMQDYADASCWKEVIALADITTQLDTAISSLVGYYKAWAILNDTKDVAQAISIVQETEKQFTPTFFPNHIDALIALQTLTELAVQAPKALYWLGCIWYDRRQYDEALVAWEQSATIERYPSTLRNLSLAYYNKYNRTEESIALLEEAFHIEPTDARLLMELDQLYKCLNRTPEDRFAFLDRNKAAAFSRDDTYLEYITLLNELGKCKEALTLIMHHQFHPWEGGEGKVTTQYLYANLELAKSAIATGDYESALTFIDVCYHYPHNLGEGKLETTTENDIDYYRALTLEKLGRTKEAHEYLLKTITGSSEPVAAMYYNDQKPDKIFYQGLALLALNREEEAKGRFNKLINFGEQHLFDTFKMDYFAVSLPDLQIWEMDMNKKNRVHCNYLIALGNTGLGHTDKANSFYTKAKTEDQHHQGVIVHQKLNSSMINSTLASL